MNKHQTTTFQVQQVSTVSHIPQKVLELSQLPKHKLKEPKGEKMINKKIYEIKEKVRSFLLTMF